MKLLPSEQTQEQLKALRLFLDNGRIRLSEPCNCDGQIRHNNGGNYHEIIDVHADAGKFFARFGTTSEYYSQSEYEERPFTEVLDTIQNRVGQGYTYR